MPRFKVRLTCLATDVLETFVEIEAPDANAARTRAEEHARQTECNWQYHATQSGLDEIEADQAPELLS